MHCCESENRREFVRRLAGRVLPKHPTMRAPHLGYVKFPSSAEVPTTKPSAPALALRPASFESWESLLAWAVELGSGVAGFVVSSEGFIIATWGEATPPGWDGLGADLCLSFDELGRADPDGGHLHAVCMMFDKYWLVGIRANVQNGFTVGLITSVFEPKLVETISAAMGSSFAFLG